MHWRREERMSPAASRGAAQTLTRGTMLAAAQCGPGPRTDNAILSHGSSRLAKPQSGQGNDEKCMSTNFRDQTATEGKWDYRDATINLIL